MPLAAAERGGHSLHPHTARLSLPLSLSISRSVCLCLSLSRRVCLLHFCLHSATACHCFSPLWTIFFFSAVFSHLPITLSQRCHLYVYLASPLIFYLGPPSLLSSPYFYSRPRVPPKQSPLEIILFAPEQNRTALSSDGQEVCREATRRITMMLAAMCLHLK